ncbi:hypothetical protein HNQ92_000409 [Rhabdobacter roseus]|uniref:DUF2975 domain-containing protein n=1 Tax=Rhabdobacter roseus TaxID=1655419 RepID=A0A840TQK7_9BACT|nr:DUF2975 domain-containing protein [Rhabdobacter roseus]MBB5282288.1 hypothetical protein [Rhabdobacter roseus]
MRTERILRILRVVSWWIYIGAIVRALVQVGFFVGLLLSKEGTTPGNLLAQPQGLLLFVLAFSLSFTVVMLYVNLWKRVKDVLTRITISNPFTMDIARMLEKTGYLLLTIWIISFIGLNFRHYLKKHFSSLGQALDGIDADLLGFDARGMYLLAAALVYVISQVFKRGVELQQENELTI